MAKLPQSTMKISIEGNIGSGKSSLLTRLCKDLRIPTFLEPVEEWKEWLDLFYEDPERWGMSFNLQVLTSYHKWKENAFDALYERSPLSNRYVFAQLQFEQGRMNPLELKMFDGFWKEMGWLPDVVIYIRCTPEVSMARMQKRGRDCEAKVPLSYLQAVHEKYEAIFSTPQPYKVYIIDGDQDADAVYNAARNVLMGEPRFPLNPLLNP